MTTANICKVTGLRERDVRESISVLINRCGVPIVANRNGRNTGMFIATTEDERNIGIAAFKSQVTTMEARINAIERADLIGWETALKPDIVQLMAEAKHSQGA
ncbi:DNA replication protein [Lactiplantibacillus pentosus]|nr:DNA replication protein [Lactiplantibacillus pentosus]MDC6398615.1 DNA replication protein [Lactiplantibacillus pentosus]